MDFILLQIVSGYLLIDSLVFLLQGINARQIHQFDFILLKMEVTEFLLDGDTGPVANFLARTSQEVKQCGLAAIRVANESYFFHRVH